MPLRRIAIDWDTPQSLLPSPNVNNYYKNRREKCDPATQGWGGSDAGCTSGKPFAYSYLYAYNKADVTHCGSAGIKLQGELDAVSAKFPYINANTQVCVYQPKVQLLDNWGWCNASAALANTNCVDFGSGVFGCYADGTQSDGFNYCDTTKTFFTADWTTFAGKVIVLP